MRSHKSINRFNAIRDLRISGNVKGLADVVQKMAKQTNQRMYRLEKAGAAKSSYGYQRAQQETGRKKPRYSESTNVYNKMDTDDLYRLALDLNAKLSSDTTTISGLKIIENKRLQGRRDALYQQGIDIDAEQLKAFIDNGGGELLNSKYLSSTQIFEEFTEITKNGNMSIEQFINEFTKGQKRIIKSGAKPFDYGKAHRNLIKAAKGKRK